MSGQKTVSPWTYKPWWCQPWSILLTGILLIGSSWVLAKLVWLTVLVSIPVLAWMGFFLLIWPSLMRQSGLLDLEQQPIQGSTAINANSIKIDANGIKKD